MHWSVWGIFFLIYLLVERRRNKVIKETKERLRQVEELLLEVCVLLEPSEGEALNVSRKESETKREPLSSLADRFREENTYGSVKVEIGKHEGTLPKSNEITHGIGDSSFLLSARTLKTNHLGRLLSLEEKREAKEECSLTEQTSVIDESYKAIPVAENHAKDPAQVVQNPKKEPLKTPLTSKKKRAHKKSRPQNQQFIPSRHQTIIDLSRDRTSVKEIARQVGMGQGEVQLIIDLYSKK